ARELMPVSTTRARAGGLACPAPSLVDLSCLPLAASASAICVPPFPVRRPPAARECFAADRAPCPQLASTRPARDMAYRTLSRYTCRTASRCPPGVCRRTPAHPRARGRPCPIRREPWRGADGADHGHPTMPPPRPDPAGHDRLGRDRAGPAV